MNERKRFEAYWRFSRANKGVLSVDRSLAKEGDQYVADSTQRHWWTWQCALNNRLWSAAEAPEQDEKKC